MAKRMVLFTAVMLSLNACYDTSKQDEAVAAARAAETAAREQTLATFREEVNSLGNPDKVLDLANGKDRFSSEVEIINDRLTVLVRPQIEGAKSEKELKELKKYALPGSSLMLYYMQRDSELSRGDK